MSDEIIIEELTKLLRTILDDQSVKRFFSRFKLEDELPGGYAPFLTILDAGVRLSVKRNIVNDAFFAKLREDIPLRFKDIDKVERYILNISRPQDEVVPVVLHLSDIHRTKDEPVDNENILLWLTADIDRYEAEGIPRPNSIVISGDITQSAEPSEYHEASEFISRLSDHLQIDRDHVVIVPGNHDIHWPSYEKSLCRVNEQNKSHRAVQIGTEWMEPDLEKYKERLRNYNEFVDSFYGDLRYGWNDYSVSKIEMKDLGITFWGLSSVYEKDRDNRGGCIDSKIISAISNEIKSNDNLNVAAWHHDMNWGMTDDSDFLSPGSLAELSAAKVNLGLCGHSHRGSNHNARQLDAYPLPVITAGSLCAGPRQRAESVPRSYNIVEIDKGRSIARVYQRTKDSKDTLWESKPWKMDGIFFSFAIVKF